MAKKSKKKQTPAKVVKQFIQKNIKYVGPVGVLVIAGIAAILIAWPSRDEGKDAQHRSIFRNGELVTIEGEYVCLPHKDTTGPQTDECALGVKTDDDRYYGLQVLTDGYSSLTGLASGDRLEVKGTFQTRDSIYQSMGVIITESIRPIKD